MELPTRPPLAIEDIFGAQATPYGTWHVQNRWQEPCHRQLGAFSALLFCLKGFLMWKGRGAGGGFWWQQKVRPWIMSASLYVCIDIDYIFMHSVYC